MLFCYTLVYYFTHDSQLWRGIRLLVVVVFVTLTKAAFSMYRGEVKN